VGLIVEETPGKPALAWTSQAACEAAYTRSWGARAVSSGDRA
jgi:hypothetical protein